jgi:predicted dehydrogenase
MSLKVAGLGAGYFSAFHYEAWTRLDGAELVGVCDRDIAKAQAAHKTAFTDPGEMLARLKPDILDIILPPEGQAQAIQDALAYPVKAIICQKPFCTSLDEARAMVKLAEDAGILLIVHENFRFQPWFRAIKRTLDQGLIGDVLQITFRMRTGDGQGPDAYLERQPYFQQMERLLIHETGVHYIDVFRYLMGRPEAVYADLRRLNPAIKGEDAGYFALDYEDGKRALFDGNRLLDHATDNPRLTFGEALVEGTFGTLSLSGDGAVTLRKFGTNEPREVLSTQDWSGFAGDCVYALCAHVAAHLTDGTPLENTARDYLEVIEIEQAIYASDNRAAKVRL